MRKKWIDNVIAIIQIVGTIAGIIALIYLMNHIGDFIAIIK